MGLLINTPFTADYVNKSSIALVVGIYGVIDQIGALAGTTLPTYLKSENPDFTVANFYLVIGGFTILGALPLIVGLKEANKKTKVDDLETLEVPGEP